MLEKSLLGTLNCKNFNSRTDLFRSLGIDSQPGGADFLESIPGHLKCLQIRVLFSLLENIHSIMTYAESLPVNRTKSRQHTKCLQVYPIG